MNTQLEPLSEQTLEQSPPEISGREDGVKNTGKEIKRNRKKRGRKKDSPKKFSGAVPVRSWFVTFMCMNIPVIGWIYLLVLAFSKNAGAKRDFAKAYLIYKAVFLLITLAILAVFVHYGLILLDQLLAYMEML